MHNLTGFRLVFAIAIATLVAISAVSQEERELRLNTIKVSSIPPDRAVLHINPIILRPQDFKRPGFSEVELVFARVSLTEDGVQPFSTLHKRDNLSLIAQLPDRPAGEAFQDTPKDYQTQSVILPRGYYVLSQITFRQTQEPDDSPEMDARSWCLADSTLLMRVNGGEVIFMGRLEFDYPTADALQDPDFNPARALLNDLDPKFGWRWTKDDLQHFLVEPTSFDPRPEYCSPDALDAGL